MATRNPKGEVLDPGLPVEGSAHLLSFADSSRVGDAMLLAEYSVEEEIRRLAKLARTPGNPRIQLTAMTRLRKIAMEAMYLSGNLQKLTARGTNEQGLSLTVEQTRLALAESRLPAIPIQEIPDVKRIEVTVTPQSKAKQENRCGEVNVSKDRDQTCIHKPPATPESSPVAAPNDSVNGQGEIDGCNPEKPADRDSNGKTGCGVETNSTCAGITTGPRPYGTGPPASGDVRKGSRSSG